MKVITSDTAGFYGRLTGFPIVENRFVDRAKAYVMEDRTIIVHPDVADRLRGLSRIHRALRRLARWLKWRFVSRPRVRRSLR